MFCPAWSRWLLLIRSYFFQYGVSKKAIRKSYYRNQFEILLFSCEILLFTFELLDMNSIFRLANLCDDRLERMTTTRCIYFLLVIYLWMFASVPISGLYFIIWLLPIATSISCYRWSIIRWFKRCWMCELRCVWEHLEGVVGLQMLTHSCHTNVVTTTYATDVKGRHPDQWR